MYMYTVSLSLMLSFLLAISFHIHVHIHVLIIHFFSLQEERQMMLNSIPPEPDKSCTEKVSCIRMRFPDGSVDLRRFLADTHTLRMVLNYVGSKGYPTVDYKVLTSFPKRNVRSFIVHVRTYMYLITLVGSFIA